MVDSVLPNPPPLGFPVPDTRHALSVQLPQWQDMCDFARGVSRVKDVQQTGYPHSFLHKDIKEVEFHRTHGNDKNCYANLGLPQVAKACVRHFGNTNMACFLFLIISAAEAYQSFVKSQQNNNALNRSVIIHKVDFDVEDPAIFNIERDFISIIRLYALFCPIEIGPHAMSFWRLTGIGIQSRLAE